MNWPIEDEDGTEYYRRRKREDRNDRREQKAQAKDDARYDKILRRLDKPRRYRRGDWSWLEIFLAFVIVGFVAYFGGHLAAWWVR